MVDRPADRLAEILNGLQQRLEGDLRSGRITNTHPVSVGSSAESDWLKLFQLHLPRRYQASRAFVVDSNGDSSDQIDIVIHDRQYSPFLYNRAGEIYVPAESVYAVIEVKQDLTREHVIYAGRKAESVRKLLRTSVEIPHAGGSYQPRILPQIVAGVVAYQSSWSPPLGEPLKKALIELSVESRLDIGCVLISGAFETVTDDGSIRVNVTSGPIGLAQFFLRLLKRLQALATVPAIDYEAYLKRFTIDQ